MEPISNSERVVPLELLDFVGDSVLDMQSLSFLLCLFEEGHVVTRWPDVSEGVREWTFSMLVDLLREKVSQIAAGWEGLSDGLGKPPALSKLDA